MSSLFIKYRTKSINGDIYNADAVDFLESRPSESADLVFLDPPFNLGKKYSDDMKFDKRPEAEYYKWLTDVLDESVRVLKDGGALYLYHLPQWAMRLGQRLEYRLTFRHWIAVAMKNGFVRGQRLYPAHYALLYFTKGHATTFSRPKLSPSRCRKCKELVKDYGGYRSIIEEKGINLSDIWDDISPLRHSNLKSRAANELPPILMKRIVQISGAPGLLYLDPFAGGGSGVLAAVRSGLRFAVSDIVRSNCALIARRLKEFKGESPSSER